MCLAIPACLIEVNGSDTAIADIGGVKKEINISLIDNASPGEWVIVHVGFALNRIDEEKARETLATLQNVLGSNAPEANPA